VCWSVATVHNQNMADELSMLKGPKRAPLPAGARSLPIRMPAQSGELIASCLGLCVCEGDADPHPAGCPEKDMFDELTGSKPADLVSKLVREQAQSLKKG
jgi:hypothetical protein